MKTNITHNNIQELMMRAVNDQQLSTLLQQSMEECDMSIIVRPLVERFDYTGEQLTAFVEEWKMMYADWYWEHCPAE